MKHPISVQINILSNTIHRKVDEFVSSSIPSDEENFTATNAKVVGYLLMNDERDIFQKDIEETLQLRRSTVSTLLQGMEKKGFITRESVAYDARVKKIGLTQKAIYLHSQIVSTLDGFEAKLTQDIDENELKVFLTVLNKMNHNLE